MYKFENLRGYIHWVWLVYLCVPHGGLIIGDYSSSKSALSVLNSSCFCLLILLPNLLQSLPWFGCNSILRWLGKICRLRSHFITLEGFHYHQKIQNFFEKYIMFPVLSWGHWRLKLVQNRELHYLSLQMPS